jgi:hypothetical protein
VRHSLRALIVIALTAIAVGYTAPDLALPWHAWGDFGMTYAFRNDTTAVVTTIRPGGPAARAGVHLGDAIDLAAMPLRDRRSLLSSIGVLNAYNPAVPGDTATFQLIEANGSLRSVTLRAVPHLRSLADNVTNELQVLSECAFAIIAMALVLVRPSALTWAFFVYGLSAAIGSELGSIYVPVRVQILEIVWLTLIRGPAALAAFIIFALRFPSNVCTGWKRIAERVALTIAAALAILSLYSAIGVIDLARGIAAIGYSLDVVYSVGYLVGAAVFVATIVSATPQERPRILWVILGFIFGYGGVVLIDLIGNVSTPPIPLYNSLQTLNILVPIAVTYAILKHRVIDVRFFLNRALVYGILTTIGIGLLVLLDFAVAKRLESFGLVVEVAGALVLGIGIQRLHGFVDGLVDRYVFRSVHEAESHLARVADAMMFAESLATIDKLVVDESARALQLRSVAIFRREDASFRREAAVGWNEVRSNRIAAEDSFVLDLQAQKTGVAASPFLAQRDDMPQGAAAPSFAVPICIREQMIGFVVFGAHLNASDIDPDEQQILERFVARATVAYDHVSNLERVAENARMRIELDFLRGLVAPASK